MEHAARGQVCFFVDGHYYAFSMDRRSMGRLARQIQKALIQAPMPRRHDTVSRPRRGAARAEEGPGAARFPINPMPVASDGNRGA
jgi:hypothetical protein